jgi:hypothetical protein
LGSLNGLEAGSIFLPRKQLIAMGMPYETPSATTDAEIMALNALLDPKKMQPKITTKIVVRYKALRGRSSVGWTFAKNFDAGRPPSRAKAYVIRLEVVMMLVVANKRQTSGKIKRQIAPALFPVAV